MSPRLIFQLLFASAIILLASINSFGQESKKYQRLKKKWNKVDGYVILNDSIKQEGLIDWYDFSKPGRYSHLYFTAKDGSVNLYYPKETLEFGYDSMKFVSDGYWFFRAMLEGDRIGLYRNVGIEGPVLRFGVSIGFSASTV